MTASSSQFIEVSNEAELSALVAQAAAKNRGVLVTGASVEPQRLRGEEDHLAISLAPMNRVVAFEPDDLTVVVEAGMTLAQLNKVIAAKGQRLALEARFPATTTVGAAVAQNLNGFVACLYGELAEQVLGLRSVTGEGSVMRSGGRVVKNVTGYDTRKLLCGSSGQLGIITEVCFRLRPKPVAERSLQVHCEQGQLGNIVRQLRTLRQKISGLAVKIEASSQKAQLYLRAEGARLSLKSLDDDLASFDIKAETLNAEAAEALWADLRDFPAQDQMALQLRYLPSQLSGILEFLPKDRVIVGDMMAGRLRVAGRVGESAEALIISTAAKELMTRYSTLMAIDGDLEDTRLRRRRFGSPSAVEQTIEERLKASFDPQGILMRGRLMQGSP